MKRKIGFELLVIDIGYQILACYDRSAYAESAACEAFGG
jgi:hypothetical protein